MQKKNDDLLPRDQIESQLAQVDLLIAMYPGNEEIIVDSATTRWLDTLRDWVAEAHDGDDKFEQTISRMPPVLSFDMNIQVESNDDQDRPQKPNEGKQIQLNIEVPTRAKGQTDSEELSSLTRVRLRQPIWMNRTQTSQVNASIPTDCNDDIVSTIEYLKDEAARHLTLSSVDSSSHNSQELSVSSDPLIRVWFYFPSLSTRAKRADLVTYAPVYDLTGFVLAGKPGVLCLEGSSRNIDEYMKYIKTESWGDIPSHHKKVSERHREAVKGGRVFNGMQEITDAQWMGEKRGERGNRNDLRALESWLDGLGLKGVFEKVLF